jgi:hypothetical protein
MFTIVQCTCGYMPYSGALKTTYRPASSWKCDKSIPRDDHGGSFETLLLLVEGTESRDCVENLWRTDHDTNSVWECTCEKSKFISKQQ